MGYAKLTNARTLTFQLRRWLLGYVAVWLCGYVAIWLYGWIYRRLGGEFNQEIVSSRFVCACVLACVRAPGLVA